MLHKNQMSPLSELALKCSNCLSNDADCPDPFVIAPQSGREFRRPQSGHLSTAPVSFIKRCWFKSRGCLESSSCSNLRDMFKNKEVVEELPMHTEHCKTPLYISTGTPMSGRQGYIEGNREETLEFPGEKWHKCCKIKGASPDENDKLICEPVEVLDKMRLHNEFKGWCGKHYCTNPRDRCLKVDQHDEVLKNPTGNRGKGMNKCPESCDKECNKSTFKLECIYTGVEPKFGTEGKATPTAAFGESEKYEVFSLASAPDPLLTIQLPPLEALQCGRRASFSLSRGQPGSAASMRHHLSLDFLFAQI